MTNLGEARPDSTCVEGWMDRTNTSVTRPVLLGRTETSADALYSSQVNATHTRRTQI